MKIQLENATINLHGRREMMQTMEILTEQQHYNQEHIVQMEWH